MTILAVNAVIGLVLAAIIYRSFIRSATLAGGEGVDRRTLNAAIYQERLEEIENDRAKESISEEVFQQMKAELQTTFLQDVESQERNESALAKSVPFQLKALVAGLPLLTLALYYLTAYNQPLRDWTQAKEQIQPLIEQVLMGETVDHERLQQFELSTFVRVLQSHLQVHPEALEGWTMLANIFRENKMVEPAYQAARKAYELAPEKVEVVAGYADLILMKNENRLTTESEAVINGYLVKEAHPSLLAMKAGAAFNAERYRIALAAWQQLLTISNSGMKGDALLGDLKEKEVRENLKKGQHYLEQSIALAKRKIAEKERRKSGRDTAGSEGGPSDQNANINASQASMDMGSGRAHPPLMASRAEENRTAYSGLAYYIEIQLSPALADAWATEFAATGGEVPLFVFIKATSGPPMPLAVKKFMLGSGAAAEFPKTVVLTQDDSMVPSLRLADFKKVNVIARLSKSGQPMVKSGDWQGKLSNIDQGESGVEGAPLRLLIDERIE